MKSLPGNTPVHRAHLMLTLGVGSTTLVGYVKTGRVPAPDARVPGRLCPWTLATIKRWDAEVGNAVESLIQAVPTIESRKLRAKTTPIRKAA